METQDVQQEILLPIDIHYNKLLDWLISRLVVKPDWQGSILEVREKINSAIQDMPVHEEITKLIKGSHINYFHCERIIEILKETESSSKNIFGYYSSQRMKDWTEVMQLYETNHLYLAEASQLLARNVNYEVPVLKKQIQKCQQTQKDCIKKEADYGGTAAEYKEKYLTTCKQLGIEGKKIRQELNSLVADLPNVYNQMAEETKMLIKARDYYTTFVTFTTDSGLNEEDILPMLRHLQTKGNTTMYEYERGVAPISLEPEEGTQRCVEERENSTSDPEIIDWGDIAYDPADVTLDIEYDLGDITIEDGGIEVEGNGETGDFSASVEFDDDQIRLNSHRDAHKDEKATGDRDDGIARGRQATTILDHTDTRNRFLDDLIELEAFLCQRRSESSAEVDVLSSCQFASAPEAIHVDDAALASMLEKVEKLLNQLTSVRMQHLCLVRNAPRYVERLEEKLKQNLSVSEKMLFYQKQSVEKRAEAAVEMEELRPKLDVLITQTKTLQKQIQERISKQYKNRPVNIMGEINSM